MEFNAKFFVSAISFIIFTILMNIILYRPLEKIVDEREDFISKNYTDATDADNKSKSLLQDKADKLAKSKLDAKSLITEKTKDANSQYDKVTKEDKDKNNKFVEDKKTELAKASDETEQAMSNEIVNLAQMISDRILKENIPISKEEYHG